MKIDEVGQVTYDSNELVDMLYVHPDLDLSLFTMHYEDAFVYNTSVLKTYCGFPKVKEYTIFDGDVEKFHRINQSTWFIPKNHADMDIAKWVLDKCQTQEELQRVGEELLLYQERDLFPLLKQLKYIIDVWRENNIVWGVGRGSSVASYVLYLIGVHKINSMYYDLDIREFLK